MMRDPASVRGVLALVARVSLVARDHKRKVPLKVSDCVVLAAAPARAESEIARNCGLRLVPVAHQGGQIVRIGASLNLDDLDGITGLGAALKGAHIEIEGTLRSREQTIELKGSSKKNPKTKNVRSWFVRAESIRKLDRAEKAADDAAADGVPF